MATIWRLEKAIHFIECLSMILQKKKNKKFPFFPFLIESDAAKQET